MKQPQAICRIEGGGTLCPAEWDVLMYLMERAGRLCLSTDIIKGVGLAPGRSLSAHISKVRKALPDKAKSSLATMYSVGYMWDGEPVRMMVGSGTRAARSVRLFVMDTRSIARRLGISSAEVVQIERKAISKLRKNPEVQSLFHEFLHYERDLHFNPFYQVWLYGAVGKD